MEINKILFYLIDLLKQDIMAFQFYYQTNLYNQDKAFLYLIYIVLSTILFGNDVQGWASTVSIMILLGGIQLFSIGVLGQYLGKTYIETKHRPIYITKETNIEKE